MQLPGLLSLKLAAHFLTMMFGDSGQKALAVHLYSPENLRKKNEYK